MSWSFSVPATAVTEFAAALDAAEPTYMQAPEDREWVEHQVRIAKETARAIADSGAVGALSISADLSGHANPEHKPKDGYSMDSVTVTVRCAKPYPPRQ